MALNNKLVSIGANSYVDLDTDATLAGDSDARVATQSAVKGYVDGMLEQTMSAAAGFSGTGTVYKASVVRQGNLIRTSIFIDLTGAKSSTTDGDVIGNTGAAHIGQITAAVNGTIVGGSMTCLELPATGADDIDLFMATVATGAFDAAVSGLTGQAALVTAGGAWANGTVKGLTAVPSANAYLYLCGGEGGTAGTYTAGKFLIELWGTA